jgi:hypothetical protein
LLLAAENQPPQRRGTFTYMSHDDCLERLGLHGVPLVDNDGRTWKFDGLWTTTGRLHMTRKRRDGDRTTIEICDYDEWKTNLRRQSDAARKRSSRGETNADTPRTRSGQAADKPRTDRGHDPDLKEEEEEEEKEEREKGGAGTLFPEEFSLSQDLIAWAREQRPDLADRLGLVTEKFEITMREKGTRSRDWVALWKRWVLNERQAQVDGALAPQALPGPRTTCDDCGRVGPADHCRHLAELERRVLGDGDEVA